VEGKGYTSLANASKYQKSFDPTCGCRKTGQSWAEALRDAEELLDRRKGDIFVTQAKSDELSRDGIVDKKSDKKKGKGKPESIDVLLNSGDSTGTTTVSDPAMAAEAATGAAAPTASQESSGIGPQTITGLSVTGKSDGKTVEVLLPSGEKRMVRVIGTGTQPR
jgi:hypothetical protein